MLQSERAPPRDNPLAGRTVSLASAPRSMKAEAPKEIIPFHNYDFFQLDPRKAIAHYMKELEITMQSDILISEIERHKAIVQEDYMLRASRSNLPLVPFFVQLIQEMDDLIRRIKKGDFDIPSPPAARRDAPPTMDRSAAVRSLRFDPSTSVSKEKGAAGGAQVNESVFDASAIKPTHGLDDTDSGTMDASRTKE